METAAPARMVERIRLRIDVRAPSAIIRSTALMLWTPAAHAIPNTAPASAPRHQPCIAKLTLQTRSAAPHELAASAGVQQEVQAVNGIVRVDLSDGSHLFETAELLAAHSPMLATFCSSSGWLECADDVRCLSLATYDALTTRLVIAWMGASDGAAKRQAAAKLLTADVVVEACRLSHYLQVEPLLQATMRTLGGALDEHNAPSILLLARELELLELEQEATRFTIGQLDAVQGAEHWAELPETTRATLRALRSATIRNPLLSADQQRAKPFVNAGTALNGRELLAMVCTDCAKRSL